MVVSPQWSADPRLNYAYVHGIIMKGNWAGCGGENSYLVCTIAWGVGNKLTASDPDRQLPLRAKGRPGARADSEMLCVSIKACSG